MEPAQPPSPADGRRRSIATHCWLAAWETWQFAAEPVGGFRGRPAGARRSDRASTIDQDDARAAAESAHALKGAAGTIAAEPLRALAAGIEATGKAGDLAEVASLVDQLRGEAQRCLRFIPELKERMNAF